jgi:hypothetical protein
MLGSLIVDKFCVIFDLFIKHALLLLLDALGVYSVNTVRRQSCLFM